MTRIAKLYASLLLSKKITLSFREFEQILRAFGFEQVRQRGSHRTFEHPTCPQSLTIQPNGSQAAPYQVRQFLDMIVEHELTMKD